MKSYQAGEIHILMTDQITSYLTSIDCFLQAGHHAVCLVCHGAEHGQPFVFLQFFSQNLYILLNRFPVCHQGCMDAQNCRFLFLLGVVRPCRCLFYAVQEGLQRVIDDLDAVRNRFQAFVEGGQRLIDGCGVGRVAVRLRLMP